MAADDIEVIHMTAVEVDRLKVDLESAYAARDQQFERKVAALRERDEAKQQLADAQRTIAAHERHINDTFEANRRDLQKARDQRDEAQDERDSLKAAVEASDTARLAADVLSLVDDYSDRGRGIIAQLPFLATFDQVCFEKYGLNTDRIVAPFAPESIPGSPSAGAVL